MAEAIVEALKTLDQIEKQSDSQTALIETLAGIDEVLAKIENETSWFENLMPGVAKSASLVQAAIHLYLWRSGINYGWSDKEAVLLVALNAAVPFTD